ACTRYPENLRDLMRNVLRTIEGQFRSHWDELGKSIELHSGRAVSTARGALEAAAAYRDRTGHDVGDLAALAASIEELVAYRERILRTWPWSTRPYPKLDPVRRGKLDE